MLQRHIYIHQIKRRFEVNPAIALLGPRQSGKTTLAKMYSSKFGQETHWFDLEDPADLAALQNPKFVLEPLQGLIVIDEVQRLPNLFPVLRVLIDQHVKGKQFLLLGSASKDLIEQSSETLAGRLSYIEVSPFSLMEASHEVKLWQRGGYPKPYLAKTDDIAQQWIKDYTAAFLERDLPMLGVKVSPESMRRFWMMLTHCHGSVINLSEIGRSLGVSHTTIRHYLDILTNSFMIRQLQPWFENIAKRQIKSPKIYFRDSGLFHYLLGISLGSDILHHPKLGASWEGFALEQVIKALQVDAQDCYFWGVHAQAELDLLVIKNGKKYGFEFKFNDAVHITKSMKDSLETLNLTQLTIIHPGIKKYQIDEKMIAFGLGGLVKGERLI